MRRASRTDKTHAAVRDGLREAGFAVFDTSQLGCGFPDLICSKHSLTFLVEVKSKRGRKSAAERLGTAQKIFQSQWKGLIVTAFSTDDVLKAWKLIVKRVGWAS